MERELPSDTGADLRSLDDSDLGALRLGAQVMAHKANLDGHRRVESYFEQLEDAARGALDARVAGVAAGPPTPGPAERLANDTDRQLVAEYLGLLAANERLSSRLRDLCRGLIARDAA